MKEGSWIVRNFFAGTVVTAIRDAATQVSKLRNGPHTRFGGPGESSSGAGILLLFLPAASILESLPPAAGSRRFSGKNKESNEIEKALFDFVVGRGFVVGG
jgi:hypothetical protein